MAIAPGQKLARVTFGGNCGSSDMWTSGIDCLAGFTSSQATTIAEAQEAATTMAGLVNTKLWNTSGSAFAATNPAGVTLDYATVAVYTGTGSGGLLHEATGTDAISSQAGTASADWIPFDQAACASMLTTNGTRSGRGRRYMPLASAVLDATYHQLSSTLVTSLAVAWQQYLQSIPAATWTFGGVSGPMGAVVFSAKLGVAYGVTDVRIDSIVDSWRRRKRDANPQYTSVQAL